ncbi:MAG: hypothetical protein OXG39_08865 [Chloroflexi bacterium]|nr:hypothetical protein [Chloroflexota bacterium]
MNSSENLRGLILVMIGPGGAGKSAIMKAIIEHYANIQQLATATTRDIRTGEQQGREHLFVSPQQFQAMIAKDELLEHQEVTPGKFYGIPRQTVADCLKSAQVRIADIEVLGARKLARAYPENVVQVFVTVPGGTIAEQSQVLEERMRRRDDGATDIYHRLQRAKELELPYQSRCDYVVVNDTLAGAVASTRAIVEKELARRGLAGASQ